MSVFLAAPPTRSSGLGAGKDENSMSGTDGSHDDGPRHDGVEQSGAHRLDAAGARTMGASQPPPSYREADDHVQLALVESTHAEANLGLLMRGLQHLLAGAGAARDAHAALSRELGVLRELLARANAAELVAMERLRVAEETLRTFRREVALERSRFIDEEDRFLAELVGDHQREVHALHEELAEAIARARAVPGAPGQVSSDRLGRAATEPSMQAVAAPSRTPEDSASEWTTAEPAFALTDWAPQPPFSLAEFALFAAPAEQKSDELERELGDARDRESGRPTPVEPVETSALLPLSSDSRVTGRPLDPEETPLPTWQAISKLESLRAPELPPDEENVPVATSQKRATLPAMPPPPAPAAAPAPGDPPLAAPQSGQVIGLIKPRSLRIPRHSPPPQMPEDDEPEPLTVRPPSPLPGATTEDLAPAQPGSDVPRTDLMDTVRPPPLIKPKPDLSQRPLREYSLGSDEVAEERLEGARGPESEDPR